MAEVAIVADDLSGAADCGLQFLRAGMRTVVHLEGDGADGGEAVRAVDTDTRRVAAATAADRVAAAVRGAGAPAVLYKKVDSTLRGHPREEIAAALSASGLQIAVVAPALPEQGRTTRGGRVLVDGEPVGDALGAQTVPLDDVRAGPSALARRIDAEAAAGRRMLVFDAETGDDLRTVAFAAARAGARVLWTGSAGLAAHVPEAMGLTGHRGRDDARPARGPVLTVVGSQTAATHAQVAELAMRPGIAAITVDPAAPGAVRERLARALDDGEHPLLALAPSELPGDLAVQQRVALALARLAGEDGGRLGGVVATGGDTARAVVRALGARAIALESEVEPGVPRGRLVGGRELPIVTKAGGFGTSRTLVACHRSLAAP